MDYSVGLADFVLLLLIGEHKSTTGYTIRKNVEGRGLAAWAGVSSSSIYNGLKRVEDQGFATSREDTTKRGRGPRGRTFSLTPAGARTLKTAIREGLSTTREHDPRFNLALSGIDQISPGEALLGLAERSRFLDSEAARLRAVALAQPEHSVGAQLLFDRIIHSIEAERRWVDSARHRLEGDTP